MSRTFLLLAVLAIAGLSSAAIRPWPNNPRYWEYDGKPVLFVGGSDDDNLFQWPEERLIAQLDGLAAAGGNQIRNTMSDRDEGNLHAFAEVEPGKYDLTRWNPEYWKRFDTLLRETHQRGILVQIELWDRFDHSRDNWKTDPYNPANNINYSFEESGFAPDYPKHPGSNEQPFFYTVPALKNNTVVLPYQQAFAREVLRYALKYDHVLYCIDNETSGSEEWGAYWAGFIRNEAAAADRVVYVTEMWDDWNVTKPMHQRTIAHPERYGFIDISQNTQVAGEANWKNAQTVYHQLDEKPRPINTTKIYGNDAYGSAAKEGKGTAHATACFWRNLIGGFATSRFHRPDHGQGLNEVSKRQIGTVREWQKQYDVFRSVPDSEFKLLEEREENEAYACSIPDEAYSVFFPAAGSIRLKVGHDNPLTLRRCNLETGTWSEPEPVTPVQGLLTLETAGMTLLVVQ